MNKHAFRIICWMVLVLSICTGCSSRTPEDAADQAPPPASAPASTKYEDLVSLFKEWREFQKPKIMNGVPDYTAAAMAKQHQDLASYRSRLEAIDPSSWPAVQRTDHLLVRAEMNGLEFDHRVLRPWSRNPCFYEVINPEAPEKFHEGSNVEGVLHIPVMPVAEKDLSEFRMKLRAISRLLAQAKVNLTEDAKDLWFLGIRKKKSESAVLDNLIQALSKHHPDLVADAQAAKAAVDEFRGWLEEKYKTLKTPSGVGIENYNWYMKNVHLVPYTFEEQMVLVERELARAMAFLKIEENRNRKLSPQLPIGSEAEFKRRFEEAAKGLMEFLRKEEIYTVPEWLHVGPFEGAFITESGARDFFTQIEYHDPMAMRCHGTHTMDDLREERDMRDRPIRGLAPLYNIWDTRAEGLATAHEEMMLQAGLFNDRPHSKELIYILLANRAARALAGLKMQSNEFSLDDGVKYSVEGTPRGWLPANGETVYDDLRLYLLQPGYGASYVIGKVQIDKLMADRANQLGDKFVLKSFMDEFIAAGMIPIALTRWEMTALDDEIKKLR